MINLFNRSIKNLKGISSYWQILFGKQSEKSTIKDATTAIGKAVHICIAVKEGVAEKYC